MLTSALLLLNTTTFSVPYLAGIIQLALGTAFTPAAATADSYNTCKLTKALTVCWRLAGQQPSAVPPAASSCCLLAPAAHRHTNKAAHHVTHFTPTHCCASQCAPVTSSKQTTAEELMHLQLMGVPRSTHTSPGAQVAGCAYLVSLAALESLARQLILTLAHS
jgi:hypothetical protein